MLFSFANVCKRGKHSNLFDVVLENFIFTFPGGEEEPGDVCEQAPEQDQP